MNENETVFEESEFVKIVPSDSIPGDEEYDSGEGRSGPTYQIKFCKNDLKILVDTKIIAEVDYKDLVPGFSRSDYKAVMQMMKDVKDLNLDSWFKKYKAVK